MAKEEKIPAQGTILESLPNGDYKVKIVSLGENDLGDDGMTITGYLSGKMRRFSISLLPSDLVDLELTPYDLTRGRITYRHHVGKPRTTPTE